MKLTDELLQELGFASYFTSDPQERDASKGYTLGNITLHQPRETEQTFIREDGKGIYTLRQVGELLLNKLNIEPLRQ